MRIDNAKFMFSFPKFSAASCQVNFSKRLCYRNVKRRQTADALARPSVGSPRYGIALGSWNPGAGMRSGAGNFHAFGSWNLHTRVELQFLVH